MRKAIKWYVLSNVHIAFCAVFFLLGGFQLFNVEVSIPLVVYIGIGTWMIYILHRHIGGKKLGKDVKEERFQVAFWPKRVFYPAFITCLLIATYAGYNIPTALYIPLIILGCISAAYIIPMFGRGRRLRDFDGVKIFLIAIVWAGVFVLPYWISDGTFQTWQVFLIWLEKSLIIFALTLPFDIRDRHLDDTSKVSTMASFFSNKTLVKAIVIILIVVVVLELILLALGLYSAQLTGCLIALSVAQYLMSSSSLDTKSEFYFLGVLDSFILLQGVIHWLI